MPGNSQNVTTIWTPQGGFLNKANPYEAPGLSAAPQRQEFLVPNPRYNPADPSNGESEYIQDPTATGTPTAFSNSAGTRGVMNPFGLTQNNPAMGYGGAAPSPMTVGASPNATPELLSPPSATPQDAGPRAGEPGSGSSFDLPPDQQGYEGHFNESTGLTTYATPNGQFGMDQYGNWTDQQGNPMQFNQTGGVDRSAGDARRTAAMGGQATPGGYTGVGNPSAENPAFNGGAQQQNYWGPGSPQPNNIQGQALPPSTPWADRAANDGRQNYWNDGPPAPNNIQGSPIGAPQNPATAGQHPAGWQAPGQPGSTFQSGGGTYKWNPDGSYSPVSTGTPPGVTPQSQPQSAFGPGSYENNVQIQNPFGSNAANPFQFATQQTAGDIARRYGGTAYGAQLEGPGYGYSTPQQQIRFANGQNINAGLAAQALGRPEYGSGAPGSYGDYNVSRDVNKTYGGDYDRWARSQPGFKENSRLANTGPGVGNQYQTASPEYMASMRGPQSAAPQQAPGSYMAQPYNASNNYQPGTQAWQTNQQRQTYGMQQQRQQPQGPGSYGSGMGGYRRRPQRGGMGGQQGGGGQWGAGFSGYRG